MNGGSGIARVAWALLLAAACGVATAAWLRARDASVRTDALAREVATLRAELADESVARRALYAETQRLHDSFAPAPRAVGETAAGAAAAVAEAEPPAASSDAVSTDAAEVEATPAPGEQAAAVDVERLVAAGFRREDVARFRTRTDQIELARVYLRDRATREGWIGTPQYREEARALDVEQAGLRGEFDESLYDWMLFSSGQPNRVGVAEVLTGSAAESAGLARGDVIVRYDEQLMLSVQDLLGATNAGRAGELVAVWVQREGQKDPIRVFLPRGPIGVRIAPVALEPSSRG